MALQCSQQATYASCFRYKFGQHIEDKNVLEEGKTN